MIIKEQSLMFCPTNAGGKEYLAQLIDNCDGTYTAQSSFGPKGNLRSTAIQAQSVSLEVAFKAYTKVIKSKLKGSSVYSIVSQSAPTEAVIASPVKAVTSPYQAQLLNSIDSEEEALALYATGRFVMQQKMDGDRMSILLKNNQITAYNRKGQYRGCPEALKQALASIELDGELFIDGEIVGDVFYAFDLLYCGNTSCALLGYKKRIDLLKDMAFAYGLCSKHFKIVLSTFPSQLFFGKAFLTNIKNFKGEGIVLKELDAPYMSGRPNSGGPQLKYKFMESSTCIVTQVNNQRSVGLALLGQLGVELGVGNVSVPANQAIPKVGDLVEVRYLYKFDGAGSLFQPVLLGIRTDLDREDCTMTQVRRIKRNEVAELMAA